MKIPKKLKIGGHTFKVVISEMENIAETDFDTQTIYINKRLKGTIKESALIHEIIAHCINTTFSGSDKIAHAFMDSISEQMYQVLKDNNLLK